MLSIYRKHDLDGITLEIPAPGYFVDLITLLGNQLHDNKKILILVVSPLHQGARHDGFGRDAFIKLIETGVVDRISLMTYDFSNSQT